LEQARPGQRPFVLTRAGFSGIQRHAVVWTGDQESTWEHLHITPAMLANLGLSGVPMVGSDVGGFLGDATPELFARWIQLGAFSPFFRAHTHTGSPPQEPWVFGSEVEAISREHIRLRYELLPYWYTLMHEASVTGTPMLRPLVMEFQDDPAVWDLSDQLMVGEHLLVAPVTSPGVIARDVYFPEGLWMDLWTGRLVQGGGVAPVPAPLQRIPVFLRAGGILPRTQAMQYVGETEPDTLWLEMFPRPEAPATALNLYEDDGISKGGERWQKEVRLETDPDGIRVTLGGSRGTFQPSYEWIALKVRNVQTLPTEVHWNGAPLTQGPVGPGWDFDAAQRTLHVRLPAQSEAGMLTARYDTEATGNRMVKLRFQVTLPEGTPPGDVFLAANALGWAPNGLLLSRMEPWLATGELMLEEGTSLEMKVTRGSWETVERAADCGDLPNRTMSLSFGENGEQEVQLTVARWADDC
jgi:alpha-glucosidase